MLKFPPPLAKKPFKYAITNFVPRAFPLAPPIFKGKSPGDEVGHYGSILGDAGDSNSVPDPDLELRGGRSSRPLDKGGGRSSKKFFSAFRASFGLTRGDPGPSPGSATVFPPLCIGIKFPTSQKTMIVKFPSLGKSKVSIPWRKPGDRGAEASAVWPILQ